MALETLKNVEIIGEFHVIHMDKLREKHPDKFNEDGSMHWQWFEKEIRPNHFIYVRNDKNSISFTIQNGPIKENGRNGCQVDQIIEVAKLMLEGLNEQKRCMHNNKAIKHLESALSWLEARKKDREEREVEGTSND